MLRVVVYILIGYVLWKIVKIVLWSRKGSGGRRADAAVEFPPDHSYRNIEDADFEDVSRDPDKPS